MIYCLHYSVAQEIFLGKMKNGSNQKISFSSWKINQPQTHKSNKKPKTKTKKQPNQATKPNKTSNPKHKINQKNCMKI